MGLAGALRIVRDGGYVIVTGLDSRRIATTKKVLGDGATVLHNDAADPMQATVLADAVRQFGRLDGLWLNAGRAEVSQTSEVSADEVDRIFAANVRGPILQVVHLVPLLREGASIVLTASSSSYQGAPTSSTYAASKGAVLALARCWANAFALTRIRVNTIVPGPIDTNFRAFIPAQARVALERYVVDRIPLARLGTDDEAAAVALFLLSDEASYVNGSQYAVDGGLVMH